MTKCYYSYSFDLDDGLIWEENLKKDVLSPMRAVGLTAPLDFDDFIDVWKSLCFPIFEKEGDEERLTRGYFQEAWAHGERTLDIRLRHNPLKNTYASGNTLVRVELFADENTKHPRATVMWEDAGDELE